MPTGKQKQNDPQDFNSLGSGLAQAATDFGKRLDAVAKKFGKSIQEQLKKAAKKFKEMSDKENKGWISTMMGKLKSGWNKFWKSGLGTALKAIAAIGAFFIGILVAAFKTFDSINVTAAKQFGMLSRGENNLVSGIIEAQKELGYLGQDFNAIAGTVTSLTNQLGMSDAAAIKMATSLAKTALYAGVSNEEAAQLTVQFTKIMGVNEKNAAAMIEGFGQLAEAAGVSPSAVLKDMAKSTEFTAKYSKGMGANILNTAIFAKKLGVELSTVEKVMNGLLDFESSITKEMEASVILGKDLNYNRARALALEGDMAGAMNEVLKQVGGQAEFDKMNAIERQVLADSIGVSVTEMAKFAAGSRSAAEEQQILDQEAQAAAEAAAERDREQLSALTDLMGIMKEFWMFIVSALKPAFDAIGTAMSSVREEVGKAFDKMDSGAIAASGPVGKIVKLLNDFADNVKNKGLDEAVSLLFKSMTETILTFLSEAIWFFVAEFGIAVGAIILAYNMLVKAIGTGSLRMGKNAMGFLAIAGATYILAEAIKTLAGSSSAGEIIVATLAIGGLLAVVAMIATTLGAGSVASLKAIGILYLLVGAIAILGGVIGWVAGMITPIVESLERAFLGLLDGIVAAMYGIRDIVVSVGEVIATVITAIADGIIGIIDAISGGLVDVIKQIQEFARLDAGNLWNVGAAYWNLSLALGAMTVTSITSGLASIVGSIGNLVADGIDSLGDFMFGSGDGETNTNIIQFDSDSVFGLSTNTVDAIGAAVGQEVAKQIGSLQITTDISGDKLIAIIESAEDR